MNELKLNLDLEYLGQVFDINPNGNHHHAEKRKEGIEKAVTKILRKIGKTRNARGCSGRRNGSPGCTMS